MSETFHIATWLYATLADPNTGVTDLATGGVFSDFAPEGTAFPYVCFQLRSSSDEPIFGAGDRTTQADYLIRAVDHSTSKVEAVAIADAIDVLLEKASGSVTGGTIVASIRNAPFDVPETSDGEVYQHVGGTYRIWAEEA